MLGSIQNLLKYAPAEYRRPTGGAPVKPAPAKPAAPATPPEPQAVHVRAGDALNITFRRGNTLSQTAASYAEPIGGGAPGARKTMVERLIAQNGGKDVIYAGRTFALSTDGSNDRLNAAIAVQKSVASRVRQGEFFPAFDYNSARVRPSTFGSLEVTLDSNAGARRFYVLDDSRGEDASLFSVFTEAEWGALQN